MKYIEMPQIKFHDLGVPICGLPEPVSLRNSMPGKWLDPGDMSHVDSSAREHRRASGQNELSHNVDIIIYNHNIYIFIYIYNWMLDRSSW